MNLEEEYLEEGAVLIKNCIHHSHFTHIDTILSKQWKKFSVDNPYSYICAEFAQTHQSAVTQIYNEVADLIECVELAKTDNIKFTVQSLLGEKARIYGKIPLRIDVPLETKELAVWHQDDFYVQGAPNELTAWIPLQDTPMHMGALSVMKKSHQTGKLAHKFKWGKKSMPVGVYDLPVNIIEMKRGDVLLFNSFLLHTSNINFSNLIRYSIQIRFTSEDLGKPSRIMGKLYDF